MLTPNIQETQQTEYSDRTYRLEFENGRITGKIDGLDAVKQAIFKLLSTQKYSYAIYSEYGSELETLAGTDFLYATSMAKRYITEALLSDDRIVSVEDFAFDADGDSLCVEFTVNTIYGSISKGVRI